MNKFLPFLVLFFLFPTLIFTQNRENIKGEIMYRIKTLHKVKDQVPEYYQLIDEYDLIVAGINAYFRDAAFKASRGLTLVRGDKISKKNQNIAEGIKNYEEKAFVLSSKIGEAIDKARETKEFQKQYGNSGGLNAILGWVVKIIKKIKKKACIDAANFYIQVRWLESEEIIKGNPNKINWNLIFAPSCAATLTKEGY